jgi:hypothetical protein
MDDELDYEPEWCYDCQVEFESEDIEYTFDYYVEDGTAYCEHCRRPL